MHHLGLIRSRVTFINNGHMCVELLGKVSSPTNVYLSGGKALLSMRAMQHTSALRHGESSPKSFFGRPPSNCTIRMKVPSSCCGETFCHRVPRPLHWRRIQAWRKPASKWCCQSHNRYCSKCGTHNAPPLQNLLARQIRCCSLALCA